MDVVCAALAAFCLGAAAAYFYIQSRSHDEVLFFPDERLPCRTFYQELDDKVVTCSQDNCQFAHGGGREATSFMKILTSLQEATSKIDLCVYDFTERQLSNFLIRKFNEGIKVRIITDAHAERKQDANSSERAKRVDQIPVLQRAGIPIKVNATSGQFVPLMHNKFVVIDDTYLLMGSFNWTHSAILRNHEAIIKTNNPKLVSEFRRKFRDMWLLLGDRPLEIVTK